METKDIFKSLMKRYSLILLIISIGALLLYFAVDTQLEVERSTQGLYNEMIMASDSTAKLNIQTEISMNQMETNALSVVEFLGLLILLLGIAPFAVNYWNWVITRLDWVQVKEGITVITSTIKTVGAIIASLGLAWILKGLFIVAVFFMLSNYSYSNDYQLTKVYTQSVVKFEGIASTRGVMDGYVRAYRDPIGIWTIGAGTTKNVYPGMIISIDSAMKLLESDSQRFARYVDKTIKRNLSIYEFESLTSFCYNVGSFGTNLKRAVRTGINVEYWIKKYTKAGGRELRGLVRRRNYEADWYSGALNHLYQSAGICLN